VTKIAGNSRRRRCLLGALTAAPPVSATCLRCPDQSSARFVASHGLTRRRTLLSLSDTSLIASNPSFCFSILPGRRLVRGIFSTVGPPLLLWFRTNRRRGGSAGFRLRPATATAGVGGPPSRLPKSLVVGCTCTSTSVQEEKPT
jgi:hypothetical protein